MAYVPLNELPQVIAKQMLGHTFEIKILKEMIAKTADQYHEKTGSKVCADRLYEQVLATLRQKHDVHQSSTEIKVVPNYPRPTRRFSF